MSSSDTEKLVETLETLFAHGETVRTLAMSHGYGKDAAERLATETVVGALRSAFASHVAEIEGRTPNPFDVLAKQFRDLSTAINALQTRQEHR